VAGRTLCPEFIQDAATPTALAAAVNRLLSSDADRSVMKAGFKEVAAKLGDGGSHERAADVVLEELGR